MPQGTGKYSLRQPRLWTTFRMQIDHGQTPVKSPPKKSVGEGIELDPLLSERNMKWSIQSFKLYKSPGPVGITPAHIQQAEKLAVKWLKKIFHSILAVGE